MKSKNYFEMPGVFVPVSEELTEFYKEFLTLRVTPKCAIAKALLLMNEHDTDAVPLFKKILALDKCDDSH